MAKDMEILRRAYEKETDSRNRRPPEHRTWEYYTVGATREDIRRLMDEGFVRVAIKTSTHTLYKLMTAPTEEEMHRVIQLMIKYSPDGHKKRARPVQDNRLL